MADITLKNIYNVKSTFYVDENCIACEACVTEASPFFKMHENDNLAFLAINPIKLEDVEKCHIAMELCPVEAIGSDGVQK